jgi:hypothetical protein
MNSSNFFKTLRIKYDITMSTIYIESLLTDTTLVTIYLDGDVNWDKLGDILNDNLYRLSVSVSYEENSIWVRLIDLEDNSLVAHARTTIDFNLANIMSSIFSALVRKAD